MIITRDMLILAKAGNEKATELILAALEPTLRRMATRLAKHLDQDDVLQVARIKVWRGLALVELSRSERSIQGYLLAIAANEMREEVRRDKVQRPRNFSDCELLTRGRMPGTEDIEMVQDALLARDKRLAPVVVPPSEALDRALSNVLRQYLKFIRLEATIRGAHKALAARKKINSMVASGAFAKAASDLRTRYPGGPAELLKK